MHHIIKMIIIDTNALMAIGQFKVDLFTELERIRSETRTLAVLEGTIQELQKIAGGNSKRSENMGSIQSIMNKKPGNDQRHARLALALLKAKKVQVLTEKFLEEFSKENERPRVDDLLVKHSQQGDLVLTQDQGLKRRLQKPYLTLRQKKTIIQVD